MRILTYWALMSSSESSDKRYSRETRSPTFLLSRLLGFSPLLLQPWNDPWKETLMQGGHCLLPPSRNDLGAICLYRVGGTCIKDSK